MLSEMFLLRAARDPPRLLLLSLISPVIFLDLHVARNIIDCHIFIFLIKCANRLVESAKKHLNLVWKR